MSDCIKDFFTHTYTNRVGEKELPTDYKAVTHYIFKLCIYRSTQ